MMHYRGIGDLGRCLGEGGGHMYGGGFPMMTGALIVTMLAVVLVIMPVKKAGGTA